MLEIRLFFISGVLLILLPTLGVPSAWKERIAICIGVIVCLAAYKSYRRHYFSLHKSELESKPQTDSQSVNNETEQRTNY